jgi:bacillithiol system protein YtxJ
MFKKIFKTPNKKKSENRIPLNDESHIEKIMELSIQNPMFIFKHSTRCGISSIILNRFEKRIKDTEFNFYLVDVLKNRSISNLIADTFNIHHESPQLISIKNGKALDHGSHSAVLNVKLFNEVKN